MPVYNRKVELTVFGARKDTDIGYGTSSELVRELLGTHIDYSGVSTGACLK